MDKKRNQSEIHLKLSSKTSAVKKRHTHSHHNPNEWEGKKLFRDLMVKKCYLNENRRHFDGGRRQKRKGDDRKVVFGREKKTHEN